VPGDPLHAGGVRGGGAAAVDEGASQIHIHARTPDGTPSYEVEDFRAITEAILAEVGDVIVNYSTGAIGIPIEKRIEYLRELQARRRRSEHELDELRQVLDAAQGLRLQGSLREQLRHDHRVPHGDAELGIKPEHECFDAGTSPTSTR
jgi:uncharacterized protein (DUF849 family)